jgi:hypothetical protein
MTYIWNIENRAKKPNSRNGCTAVLYCEDVHDNRRGACYVEGWLYGCALMGLSNLAGLSDVPVEAWPSFREFLTKLSVYLNDPAQEPTTYYPRRFMFTLAGAYAGKFADKLVQESELVVAFDNWAHASAKNKMYFLNLGKSV